MVEEVARRVEDVGLGKALRMPTLLSSALGMRRGGQLESAAAAYEEILSHEQEKAEAIPCWERVPALEPARAGTCVGLGWAHQEEGRLAGAAEHYRATLRLQPDLVAAHLNLSGLHEEQGDLAGAEAAFREALRLRPTFAMPHACLAVGWRCNPFRAGPEFLVGRQP